MASLFNVPSSSLFRIGSPVSETVDGQFGGGCEGQLQTPEPRRLNSCSALSFLMSCRTRYTSPEARTSGNEIRSEVNVPSTRLTRGRSLQVNDTTRTVPGERVRFGGERSEGRGGRKREGGDNDDTELRRVGGYGESEEMRRGTYSFKLPSDVPINDDRRLEEMSTVQRREKAGDV